MLAEVFAKTPGGDYYSLVPPAWMEWENRRAALERRITELDCDILAVQEVDMPEYRERWASVFDALGYGSFLQDDKGRAQGHSVANATLWKKERFRATFHESRSRTVMTVLEERETKRRICLGNVHLQGAPHMPELRFSQLKSLLSKMAAKMQEYARSENLHRRPEPLYLVMGDFNAGPEEGVYRMMVEGSLPAGYSEASFPAITVTQKFYQNPLGPFDSAYRAVAGAEPELTFSLPPLRAAPIDFIFFSKAAARPVEVLDSLSLAEEEREHIREKGLPTLRNGSDHLPIAGLFEWV